MSREDENLDELFRNADPGKVPPFDDSYWNEMEELLFDDGSGVDELFAGAAISAPPYKEAYWKEMQAMLPEKKRRAAFWWYAAAGFLLIGTFSWYLLSSDGGNSNPGSDASHPNISGRSVSDSGSETQRTVTSSAEQIDRGTDSPRSMQERRILPDVPHLPVKVEEISPDHNSSVNEVTENNAADRKVGELEKLQTGVSYSMALVKFAPAVREDLPKRFYVQAGAGIGQSFMRTAEKSGFTHFYTVGAGLYQHSGNFVVTFGLQGKIGFVNNISSAESNSETQYRELYGIETPLTIGWRKGSSIFGVGLTPGIQAGYSGMYLTYNNESGAEESHERISGKVPAESTLTMQLGLNFARVLSESWMLGGQVNADILSPYGNGAFVGEARRLPVNGCVFLRRSF